MIEIFRKNKVFNWTENIELWIISYLSCYKLFSIDILYVANKWFSILEKRYIDGSILFFLHSNCKSYILKDKKETPLHQIQPNFYSIYKMKARWKFFHAYYVLNLVVKFFFIRLCQSWIVIYKYTNNNALS